MKSRKSESFFDDKIYIQSNRYDGFQLEIGLIQFYL